MDPLPDPRVFVNNPQAYARLAGLLYVITIVLGAFAEGYAMDRLLVPGDATATAHNIMASPGLWNAAVGCDLIIPVIAVLGIWISYLLLRPVNGRLVLLDVFLTLMSLGVEAVSKLFLLLVLPILNSSNYPRLVDASQLAVIAGVALKSHAIAFDIALIFFGFACLVEGYLLYKSRYFPRFLGVFMQVAGVCYLISCFAELLAPALAERLVPAILLPPLAGELTYAVWLLIKGVDLRKWNERERGSTAQPHASA